jgi:hypothetical protein
MEVMAGSSVPAGRGRAGSHQLAGVRAPHYGSGDRVASGNRASGEPVARRQHGRRSRCSRSSASRQSSATQATPSSSGRTLARMPSGSVGPPRAAAGALAGERATALRRLARAIPKQHANDALSVLSATRARRAACGRPRAAMRPPRVTTSSAARRRTPCTPVAGRYRPFAASRPSTASASARARSRGPGPTANVWSTRRCARRSRSADATALAFAAVASARGHAQRSPTITSQRGASRA